MTSNEKNLNYKVADIVESYNFHINVISIRVHTKKIMIFLKRNCLCRHGNGSRNRYSNPREVTAATAVARGGRSLLPFTVARLFLTILRSVVYFWEIAKWKIYYRKIPQLGMKKQITAQLEAHSLPLSHCCIYAEPTHHFHLRSKHTIFIHRNLGPSRSWKGCRGGQNQRDDHAPIWPNSGIVVLSVFDIYYLKKFSAAHLYYLKHFILHLLYYNTNILHFR
jgi:hypothetical protein